MAGTLPSCLREIDAVDSGCNAGLQVGDPAARKAGCIGQPGEDAGAFAPVMVGAHGELVVALMVDVLRTEAEAVNVQARVDAGLVLPGQADYGLLLVAGDRLETLPQFGRLKPVRREGCIKGLRASCAVCGVGPEGPAQWHELDAILCRQCDGHTVLLLMNRKLEFCVGDDDRVSRLPHPDLCLHTSCQKQTGEPWGDSFYGCCSHRTSIRLIGAPSNG